MVLCKQICYINIIKWLTSLLLLLLLHEIKTISFFINKMYVPKIYEKKNVVKIKIFLINRQNIQKYM